MNNYRIDDLRAALDGVEVEIAKGREVGDGANAHSIYGAIAMLSSSLRLLETGWNERGRKDLMDQWIADIARVRQRLRWLNAGVPVKEVRRRQKALGK